MFAWISLCQKPMNVALGIDVAGGSKALVDYLNLLCNVKRKRIYVFVKWLNILYKIVFRKVYNSVV